MKNSIVLLFTITCFFNVFAASSARAGDDSFTQKDRELLIRIDERLNQVDKRLNQVDKRFEQVDRRFEQVDRRFEQVDKRFEQVDKRFEQVDRRIDELRQDMNRRFGQIDRRFESQQNLMMAIIGAFAAIVAVAIGFAIWDRRTMVRPFEYKVKKIENDIVSDRKRLESLFEVLRNYAKRHPDLADILKQFSIL